MIGFILLTVLTILLIVGFIFSRKKENYGLQAVCGILLVLAGTGFIASAAYIVTRPSDEESFYQKRERCANLVYSINDKMTTETINGIISEALYINREINNNKKHVDSKFRGCYYSRKIAEAEPISIPEFKISITE